MYIEMMIEKGSNSNDMATLIGILCKVRERHAQVINFTATLFINIEELLLLC